MRLDYLTRRFVSAQQQYLHSGAQRLTAAAAKLDALSPLRVLSRGYAIASTESGVIKSVRDIPPGGTFTLRVSDGELPCAVRQEE